MGSYKRFPVEVWNLFEELLKTRLTGIKGKLAELELGIKKVAASETADKLTTAYTIDGVEFDGSADIKHYGVCTTASGTAIKTVSCTGFKLKTGAMIAVRFDNADTSTDATQLNVNSTGSRLVKYRDEDLPNYAILADSTLLFQYNGTWYEYVGTIGKIYTPFTASTNELAGGEGLVPAPAAGKDASYFLNSQGNWEIPHDTTYNVFTSASSTNAGTQGLVPAPTVGTNNTYFLNASGSWSIPYAVFNSTTNGLVPNPGASSTTKYLRADGSWATPTNTTYKVFSSTNCTVNGSLIPSVAANTTTKYLRADGSWQVPPDTKYTLPAATNSSLGGVKIGTNINVTDGTISVSEVDTTSSGLMTAADKIKLDGIADGANNYTYTLPNATTSAKGGVIVGTGLGVNNGTISLAAASAGTLGGVKVAAVTTSNISLNAGNISVPIATATQAGAVKIGTNVSISSGIISIPEFSSVRAGVVPKSDNSTAKYLRADGSWVQPPNDNTVYTLPAATTNELGGVIIPANGGISNTDGSITLAAASANTIGGVKIGSGISTGAGGIISIPSASTSVNGLMTTGQVSKLNGIDTGATKNTAGSNVTITDGAIAVATGSTSALGVLKVGSNLSVNNGTISLSGTNVNAALGYTAAANTVMTAASSSAAGAAGLVPAPAAGKQASFLRGDGTWVVPNNTTYKLFSSANCTVNGTLVPSIAANTTGKYLQSNGSWATPTNTTYAVATTSANGLMSSTDKSKLDAITAPLQYKGTVANFTDLPTTGLAIGYVYNITNAGGTDANGTAIKAGDNVAYNGTGWDVLSGTVDLSGYVTKDGSKVLSTNDFTDAYKTKLDGIADGANNYTYTLPNATTSTKGGVIVGAGLSVNNGTISLAAATTGTVGGIKLGTSGFLRYDGAWATPTNTTYAVMTAATSSASGKSGLTPTVAAGNQAKFLRGDATWAVPTNTTYSVFASGTCTVNGTLIPSVAANTTTKYLRSDGTWQVPPDNNTTYSAGTGISLSGTAFGLKSASTSEVGGITLGTSGFLRYDGTWATPTNTTYAVATTSANGLMPAADKSIMNSHFHHVSTAVTVGTHKVVAGYPWFILECTTAGTTGSTAPTTDFAKTSA